MDCSQTMTAIVRVVLYFKYMIGRVFRKQVVKPIQLDLRSVC